MIFSFFEMHLYIRLWGPNFYVSHSGLSEKLGSSSWIEPHKAFKNPHCNSQHIAENCLTYKDSSSIYNIIICPLRQSTQANSGKKKKKFFSYSLQLTLLLTHLSSWLFTNCMSSLYCATSQAERFPLTVWPPHSLAWGWLHCTADSTSSSS